MAGKRTSNETRRKLLDSGVAAFISQGYHGTGIKEVLDEVGVPKGSFYNYFDSKEQFGAEVIRHFSSQQAKHMDLLLNQANGDALSILKQYFEQEINRHELEQRVGCLLGNLGAEMGDRSQQMRQAMVDGLVETQTRFAILLARAQAQGTVRKDVDAEELAFFLLNAYEGAILRMKIEGSLQPLRRFRSLVLDKLICHSETITDP